MQKFLRCVPDNLCRKKDTVCRAFLVYLSCENEEYINGAKGALINNSSFIIFFALAGQAFFFLARLTSPSDLRSATSPFRQGKTNQKRALLFYSNS